MNKIRSLLLAVTSLALAACSGAGGGAGYSFPNQSLQGQIGGTSWTYVSGTADSTVIAGELWFDLYDLASANPDPFAFNAYPFTGINKVIFTISPAATGFHQLGFGTGQQTVTLYEGATGSNDLSTDGALEILTIDAVNKIVTGRIDARFDSGNHVSGNFTAAYR